jgi:S-adenosylmethionine uptake transporter
MPADHRSPLWPFLVACCGIGTFSVMDAAMKELTIAIGVYNAVLWRCIAGSAMGGALFVVTRQSWPPASTLKLHALRSLMSAGMTISFFWALARLPLAEAIALSFIAPLITLYLAAIFLGEKVGSRAVIASLLGLAGVGVIMSAKLGVDGGKPFDWLPVAAIFFSAILYAINLILARKQAKVAGPVEIAFFQNLLVALILMIGAPWFLTIPDAAWNGHIALSAALATLSVLLLAWAYARAEAQVLVMVEYTAFIWAAAIGWWWFGEALAWQTVAGVVLIVAGCLLVARGDKKPAHIEVTAA